MGYVGFNPHKSARNYGNCNLALAYWLETDVLFVMHENALIFYFLIFYGSPYLNL